MARTVCSDASPSASFVIVWCLRSWNRSPGKPSLARCGAPGRAEATHRARWVDLVILAGREDVMLRLGIGKTRPPHLQNGDGCRVERDAPTCRFAILSLAHGENPVDQVDLVPVQLAYF